MDAMLDFRSAASLASTRRFGERPDLEPPPAAMEIDDQLMYFCNMLGIVTMGLIAGFHLMQAHHKNSA